MEGILPMVFRIIKKHKNRRKYHCLSSGAAIRYKTELYNDEEAASRRINDDYIDKIDYRRYSSATESSVNGFPFPQHSVDDSPNSKKLVNYKVGPCITGLDSRGASSSSVY